MNIVNDSILSQSLVVSVWPRDIVEKPFLLKLGQRKRCASRCQARLRAYVA